MKLHCYFSYWFVKESTEKKECSISTRIYKYVLHDLQVQPSNTLTLYCKLIFLCSKHLSSFIRGETTSCQFHVFKKLGFEGNLVSVQKQVRNKNCSRWLVRINSMSTGFNTSRGMLVNY